MDSLVRGYLEPPRPLSSERPGAASQNGLPRTGAAKASSWPAGSMMWKKRSPHDASETAVVGACGREAIDSGLGCTRNAGVCAEAAGATAIS